MEGILQNVIYRKLMYSSEINHYKVGELLNMMSFDSRKVGKFFGKVNLVWQTPMTIFSAFLVLYYFSGNAIFIGLFTMALLFPLTFASSIYYTNHTADYYKIRDERGKFMNDMISSIKLIKYFGLEEKFKKMVNKIRTREYDSLRRSAVFDVLQVFSQKLVILSGSIMTIVFYALIYGNLDLSHVFTTISFFNMLEKPILEFGDNIFDFGLAYVSFKRIQKFFDSTIPKKTTDEKKLIFFEEIQPLNEDIAISFQNATFQFEENNPILKNINLDVKQGSFICITGPTGTGKSSLFKAICGELEKVSGSLQVKGKIALCTQTPWLINKTIRENIIFGRPFNKDRYDQIIQLCQLEKDFSVLPHKDLTDVIQNGSNLSGGQRHRLSLARACYADQDIYLIDSTFSALDNHLQNAIFNNCIKGFLKKKTILLITHNPTFTQYCDKVLYFDKGEISENIPKETKIEEFQEHSEQLEETDYQPKSEIQKIKLPEEITMNDYSLYFGEYGNWFTAGLIFILLFVLSKLSIGGWLSIWSKDRLGFTMNQYIVVYIIIGLFQLSMIPAHRMSFIYGGMKASRTLHDQMFMRILNSPLSFFEKTKKGEICNRFLEDQQKIDDWVPYYYNNFFIYLEYALVTIGLIIIITPPSIFFIIIIGVLFFGILLFIRRPQHLLGTFVEASKEPMITNFESTITGLTTIRTLDSQEIFCREHEKQIDYHHRSRWMEIILFRWTSIRMETLGSLIVFSSSIFIILFKHQIDPAIAALSITYSLTISETFTSLINVSYSAESGLISFQRIYEYTKLPIESYHIGTTPPKKWPTSGKIEFQNVTMKYGLHIALNNLNMTFGPDERIGIVGRTGSGKSSLFSSLFRIVELSQGSILIDGIDISTITLNALRSNISIIPQEPILLSGTLRFNIDPFDKFSDYQIWKVLDDIHIKKKIEIFHLKLDDKIELFSNFSVGEKQLISVARTILSDTKLVLLDEATSNIDQTTDSIIQEIIKEKFKNKTLMIIAHRIHSVMNCDKIMVMDKGKIIEYDTPQNLLLNESSEFSKLVKKMEKF